MKTKIMRSQTELYIWYINGMAGRVFAMGGIIQGRRIKEAKNIRKFSLITLLIDLLDHFQLSFLITLNEVS